MSKFQLYGDYLTGRGLSFDKPLRRSAEEFVDMAEAIYRQGRESVLPSYDDRFDLQCAVESLRALAVIVGHAPQGDRYRRAADILARLLQAQQESGA